MVGGDYIPRNLKVLAAGGRLVQIAVPEGARREINLLPLDDEAADADRLDPAAALGGREGRDRRTRCASKVWPLLDAGSGGAHHPRHLPLAKAADAHRLMESSAHIGKIVLDHGLGQIHAGGSAMQDSAISSASLAFRLI